MSTPPNNDRSRWETLWRDTVWEFADGGTWSLLLPAATPVPLVVVTAWNPFGQRLSLDVNTARDAVLRAEIQALGCPYVRARGRSPDGRWCEDGWQFPHLPSRTQRLLQRYGQLAGLVADASGAHYCWNELLE
jgi:Protein of unknown function (DUF3293)